MGNDPVNFVDPTGLAGCGSRIEGVSIAGCRGISFSDDRKPTDTNDRGPGSLNSTQRRARRGNPRRYNPEGNLQPAYNARYKIAFNTLQQIEPGFAIARPSGSAPTREAVTRLEAQAIRTNRTQFQSEAEARIVANNLGYREVRNQRSHGSKIYTNGSNFISRDRDSHRGGAWKVAGSINALRQPSKSNARLGTFTRDLKTKVGK